MTRWTRAALLLAFLLAAVSPVIYWKLSREKAEMVTVIKASSGTIQQTISATGSVEAHRKILVTTEPGGRVAALYFEEQDRVAKGQVLAKLDDAEISTQLRQAESALKLADGNLAGAAATLSQTKVLHEKGYVAQQEVEASQRQVDLHGTQVEEKKATIQLLKTKLERSLIRAPISGVVTRKFVEVGGMVSDGSRGPGGTPGGQLQPIAIAEVAQLGALAFQAEVDQTDIDKVKRGQQAVIALDAFPDRRFSGTVAEITVSSMEETGGRVRYRVKVGLQHPDVPLRLGMTGTIEFILVRKEHVMTLPAAVVLQKEAAESVFVVEAGRAYLKPIRTGLRNDEIVEVISGLQAGDGVIDQGRGEVKDGQAVEVLNEKR